MKKNFLLVTLLLIMTLLSGCNHTNTTEENASIMAESIETEETAIVIPDIEGIESVSIDSENTNKTTTPIIEEESIQQETSISDSDGQEKDIYEGEYNDYDVDEPNLEIKKNEDGSYLIQIGIYRLTLFDNCIGKKVENGLEFSTPEGVEPYATGIITFDGDIATVTFMEPFWFSAFSDVNEYKYHKTSDIPNIYVPEY